MPNTINLESFLARIALAVKRESDAEKALAEAHQYTAQVHDNEKKNVLVCLDKGETTGNPLKDAMLRHFGLDMVKIESVLAFSNSLAAAKGQYMLMCLTRQVCHKHVMIPTSGNDNTYHTEASFILGELSGQPLEALPAEDGDTFKIPKFVLPLTSFVEWETYKLPEKKELRPYILKGGGLFTSTSTDNITSEILLGKLIYPPELHGNLKYYTGDLKYYVGQSLEMAKIISALGMVRGLEYKDDALQILAGTPPPLDTTGSS